MAGKHRIPRKRINRHLNPQAASLWRPFSDVARAASVGVTGTRGVGKTTALFLFTWIDAIIDDKPLVALLPISGVFDLYAMQVCQLHPKLQEMIWRKTRYVPLSGLAMRPDAPLAERYILPTPLYYRTGIGEEDPYEISQRLPEVLLRCDPALKDAPIQGHRAVTLAATQAGRILIACGLPVTHMADLLTRPQAPSWQRCMDQAVRNAPSVADAVAFFRNEYMRWSPGKRDERTHALMARLAIPASPLMQAQFGAPSWAVPWQDVIDKRLKVFIDISHMHSEDMRRFSMIFLFLSLIDHLKRYGATLQGDRSHPISIIIDELAVMVGGKNNPIAQDLDELINTYSRNFNLQICLSFLEPFQIEDPKVLDTLMSVGTKFYGRMTDPTSSRLIADRAVPYDPFQVKETISHHVGGLHGWDEPRDYYFTRQEQIELARQRFDNLEALEFLVSRTVQEGAKPLPLQHCSLRSFRIVRPDPTCVADVKRRLVLRDGVQVKDVLAQIAASQDHPSRPPEHYSASGDDDLPLETDFYGNLTA